MTEVKRLTDQLSVSAFIQPRQLAGLGGRFRTIINNRPDGEEPGQASSAELEQAARAAGLDYRHIPVVASQIGEADIAAFQDAVGSGVPTLAFCRTGTRSTMMWALSQAGNMPVDEILATAAGAGYDLSGMAPLLQSRASR